MATKAMIDDALRYIGVSKGKGDEEMILKVTETFSKMEQIVQPRYVYSIFEIKKDQEGIALRNTNCNIKSEDLMKLFAQCERCIVMAVTLGVMADREINRRQRLSMLEAVAFDACCSVLVEKICDEAEEKLMNELKEGEYLTMRFSPGYGDVPLEVSRDILQILHAGKRIGLALTQTDMLVPSKSITALIGISSQKENRQKSCGRCNLVKSCLYRKRGERCGL